MNIEFKLINQDMPKHAPAIVELVKSWYKEHFLSTKLNLPLDVDFDMFFSEGMQKHGMLIAGYDLDNNHKLVAVYGAVLGPYFYSKQQKFAHEFFWCVHKDYQKKRVAYLLLKQLEIILPTLKVNLAGLMVPAEHEHLGKSLEKLGYHKVETLYMRKF